MIARRHRFLIWTLLGVCLVLSAAIAVLRKQARLSLAASSDAPRARPIDSVPIADATLMIASDADGSLTPVVVKLPLRSSPTSRARALLQALFDEYAGPRSMHPLPAGTAIEAVFLTPVPATPAKAGTGPPDRPPMQLAVVDLSSGLAENHPSGIEAETLTLLSVIATLHANLPGIGEVRFLVNGRQRDTLAGHADLSRVYLASDSEVRP